MTTEELCESLIHHLESTGDECFEKNYIKNGEILASVFAIVGPNAEEMTALFREWCNQKGLKRIT